MRKSAVVRARIEPELKENAEANLERLGLNATQAIALFYRQVALRNALPFEVSIPNDETIRAIDSTDAGLDLVVCKDADELFEKLGT